MNKKTMVNNKTMVISNNTAGVIKYTIQEGYIVTGRKTRNPMLMEANK